MNYYERHLGDYARDTAHLSLLEHGVYTLLLDRYYATEAPIPADQAYRVARARSKEERAAVDAVLAEYFTSSQDGWRNSRADWEIERYRESEPDRELKRAHDKERQRRARDGRRSLFAALRERGIVPSYETPTAELRSLLSRATSAQGHAHVTRDNTATRHQSPDTSHQIELGNSSGDEHTAVGAGAPDRPPESTPAGEACRAMREAGVPVHLLNPEHAELLAALAAGATPAEFGATAAELIASGKPAHMTYIVRAVVGRRADAARQQRAPPASAAKPSVADSFAGKSYTGTPDHDLPEHLRPAA